MAIPVNLQQMHTLATNAMLKAYTPYSNFKVGACILTPSGNLYAGCNIENASYPCGSCAENAAISAMIMAGEHQIKEILVIGGLNGKPNQQLTTPCGQCRQKINEFSKQDCIVHIANSTNILLTIPLNKLLTYAFGPNNLN